MVLLPTPADTTRLGAAIARALLSNRQHIETHGFTLGLSGELGSGKTSLVRAILRGLGEMGAVKSPTFAVLEPYVVSSLDFYHFDFYRFKDPAEFDTAGFREMFRPGAMCAIEWPERAAGKLPTIDLAVTLEVSGDGRRARIEAASDIGATCLQHVLTEMPGAGSTMPDTASTPGAGD